MPATQPKPLPAVAQDKNELKKHALAAQKKELEDFAQKIKRMFKETDQRGIGIVTCQALAQLLRDLDEGWTPEDVNAVVATLDKGNGTVSYEELVDWFMEEENPSLRKELWQDLTDAFGDSDSEDSDDDTSQADLMEMEEELETALCIDLDDKLTLELWLGVVARLDLDEKEARCMYKRIVEEWEEKGIPDDGTGYPLKEYLEELKIHQDDSDGIKHFAKQMEDHKDHMAKGNEALVATGDGHTSAIRTMFDKVVYTLDRDEAPAEDAWKFFTEGKLLLSKIETAEAQAWESRTDEFIEVVRGYMLSPPLVNARAGQTFCKERCVEEVNQIIKKYQTSGTKFIDQEWNVKADPNSVLWVDKEKPGYDCTAAVPVKWMRLTDIVKNSGNAVSSLFGGGAKKKEALKPVLFKGGVKPGDIVQGQIGTCFLLGAMGAVAGTRDDGIKKLFIKYDVDAGVYGIRFNIDGNWRHVIVDDFMPVDSDGKLMYAHSKDPQEVWVPVLEKAFCKVHTCFEMCDGGQSVEALSMFFGGVGGKFEIKKKHREHPDIYFKILKQARDHGWLLTTGFVQRHGRTAAKAALGKCGEAVLPTGLVGGHAYSVLKVVEAHGNQLVSCRNPWGTGEWTGRWSDENAYGEWTDEMKQATGYKLLDDGKFWMCIADFVKHSAGVEYARTFGPDWKRLSQYKHFDKSNMSGTAQQDYTAKKREDISFSKGDTITIQTFTSDWWTGTLKQSGKSGFFPGSHVKLDDKPVAAFELVGTPDKDLKVPMTAVVLLLQPNKAQERRWYRRREDGLNYKDTSYASLQLVIIAPDGTVAIKKEARQQCVWGELKLPAGGAWRIYALSTCGTGHAFTVRAFIKDGTATLTELSGETLNDVRAELGE